MAALRTSSQPGTDGSRSRPQRAREAVISTPGPRRRNRRINMDNQGYSDNSYAIIEEGSSIFIEMVLLNCQRGDRNETD